MNLRICHAIAERRLIMFAYKGTMRVAEPHLYGETTAGNEAVSAWMSEGWSRSDPDGGWRMFRIDELVDLSILPERFDAPRPGFNPVDPHFTRIFCALATDAAPAEPDARDP
jgi:hypothetical protein